MLRAAIETCQPLVDRRRHTLSVQLPGEPGLVNGDPVRLAQVFANLLNNAAKYTPSGGHIELRMEVSGDAVQVVLSDSGVGIAADLLPRIFDLFTQASPDLHGLGIGLFLVRGLVRMHDGQVTAHSEGDGRGSRFVVSLPRVAAVAASAPAADEGSPARNGRKVLVVDDNADAADTLAQLLDLLGHEAATAADGASALARFEEFQPEIVLLDIGLPDLDGYEVARRMRSRAGEEVQLVALTGFGQSEDKRRAAEAGFDQHWTKPVDPARLSEL